MVKAPLIMPHNANREDRCVQSWLWMSGCRPRRRMSCWRAAILQGVGGGGGGGGRGGVQHRKLSRALDGQRSRFPLQGALVPRALPVCLLCWGTAGWGTAPARCQKDCGMRCCAFKGTENFEKPKEGRVALLAVRGGSAHATAGSAAAPPAPPPHRRPRSPPQHVPHVARVLWRAAHALPQQRAGLPPEGREALAHAHEPNPAQGLAGSGSEGWWGATQLGGSQPTGGPLRQRAVGCSK